MKNKIKAIPALMIFICAKSYSAPYNITIPTEMTQNAFHYIAQDKMDNLAIAEKKLVDKRVNFYRNYFYSWSETANQYDFYYVPYVKASKNNVLDLETGTIEYYKKKQGYDARYLPHQEGWITDIANKMDLANFPNISCENKACLGIMVDNAQVRSLPTFDAFYRDFTQAGEGYPFDYIQLSDLWLGTPVMRLQTSKDKRWVLVKGNGVMGWVPSSSVAKVDKDFVNNWQQSNFVTPTERVQQLRPALTLSSLQSIEEGSLLASRGQMVSIPQKNAEGFATLVGIDSSKLTLAPWPIAPTFANMAMQINQLTWMPYGWGGKDFHSDCSGLMRRLFSAFGIWLPRSSFWQTGYAGKRYDLSMLSRSQRERWLIDQQGSVKLPVLMTLVSFGSNSNSTSHIGLYFGTSGDNEQKTAIMFNQPWGVKITNEGTQETGRALVGHSLITPIGIGETFADGLAQKGWLLTSLWDTKGFNVTLVDEPFDSSTALPMANEDPILMYVEGK